MISDEGGQGKWVSVILVFVIIGGLYLLKSKPDVREGVEEVPPPGPEIVDSGSH